MSFFLTDLDVRLVSESKNGGSGSWMLVAPLLYNSDAANAVIRVPSAFVTDFASVPRVPVVFDLMGDIAHSAAVLHDYLYSTGEVPRSVADKVFREAAIVSGVSKWKAWAMWVAVRVFGASRYSKK